MKKIKYLIGAFIFGFCLLLSSQSFARNIYVDGVSTADITSSTNRGANYLYLFSVQVNKPYSTSDNRWAFFGYQLYYNGSIQFNYLSDWHSYSSSACNSYSSYLLNSSVYGFSGYNGSCNYNSVNQSYTLQNISTITSNSYDLGIRVLLGQNNLSGRNFITVGSSFDGLTSPKYGFGPGFFSTNDYLTVNESFSDYYRLFYKSLSDGNGGYLNSLDYLDIATLTYSGINSSQVVGEGWEYFYPKGTRTNYGYIVDDGQSYTKYKHFGLFDMGYSYTYGKVGQEASSISWSQLGFRTVSDAVETSLKLFGSVSYDDLNGGVGTSKLSWNGLLLLRGNQYVSFGNDDGVYILSKDPFNYSRVLYEHYSCSLSNIDEIFNGNSLVQSCVKLDGGYLTYNGNTSVLPFTDGSTSYSISSIDNDYPLLYDLVNGGNGLTSVHGMTVEGSSCLYINQFSRCYGFSSDSSVDIKETYLNSLVIDSPDLNYSLLRDNCINNPEFYLNNISLCSSIGISDPSGYFSYGSGEYRMETACFYSGDVKYCTTKVLPVDFTGDVYVDSGGTVYYLSDNTPLSSISTINGINYVSGYIDSEGLFSGSYFDSFFNSSSLFFSCPYPPIETFSFITKIKIGNFYPLMPINCMFSAFNVGSSIHYFDDYGVFTDSVSHSLLIGDTKYHKILFRFFDVLLSFGIFLILSSLYRLFNK